jgi:hypothetical protein
MFQGWLKLFCSELHDSVNALLMILLERLFIRDRTFDFSSPSFLSVSNICFLIRDLCTSAHTAGGGHQNGEKLKLKRRQIKTVTNRNGERPKRRKLSQNSDKPK